MNHRRQPKRGAVLLACGEAGRPSAARKREDRRAFREESGREEDELLQETGEGGGGEGEKERDGLGNGMQLMQHSTEMGREKSVCWGKLQKQAKKPGDDACRCVRACVRVCVCVRACV